MASSCDRSLVRLRAQDTVEWLCRSVLATSNPDQPSRRELVAQVILDLQESIMMMHESPSEDYICANSIEHAEHSKTTKSSGQHDLHAGLKLRILPKNVVITLAT